jgi:hypothetical protein
MILSQHNKWTNWGVSNMRVCHNERKDKRDLKEEL